MTNPIVDLIGDRTGRIVPIYPQSEKVALTTWEIAGLVENALERCTARGIADPVPWPVRAAARACSTAPTRCALIHLPETMADKARARRRLAFDELLRVQTVLVMRKRALERDSLGIRHDIGGELVGRLRQALPYELTGAQQRVIAEIEADLAGPHPMHRLLQGDVGAGKTLVAVSAMLTAVQGGHQAALMAPTEVLAEQHATGIRRLLDGVTVPDPGNLFGDRPLRVELLTNRDHRRRPARRAGRPGRRRRRHRHRHARADPGGGVVRAASASSSSTSSIASASSSAPRCATRPAGERCPTCW